MSLGVFHCLDCDVYILIHGVIVKKMSALLYVRIKEEIFSFHLYGR